jgi:hypothetical protein
VQFKGGGCDIERPWSVAEIDDHRKKFSKQGTDKKTGARAGIWRDHFESMMLIPPLRKLLKRCPVGIDSALLDEPVVGEVSDSGEITEPEHVAPRQINPRPNEPDLESLLVEKGVTPGEACGWLNQELGHELDHEYEGLPPAGELPSGHRVALIEWLSSLPTPQHSGELFETGAGAAAMKH